MRLSRRRGPSAQLASPPRAALSTPNQNVRRRLNPSADRGSLPNQKSRTLRASSMGCSRIRAGAVGLEQPLELLGGGDRGGAELLLVILDRVLRLERLLIVLTEAAHRFARVRLRLAERLEHRGCDLQARRVGLAR